MWSCTSWANGTFVRIDAPDGRSAWLQGDDAARVLADLDHCATEEVAEAVLSQYEAVLEVSA